MHQVNVRYKITIVIESNINFISKYKVHHVDLRYKIIIDVTRWKHEVSRSIIKSSITAFSKLILSWTP